MKLGLSLSPCALLAPPTEELTPPEGFAFVVDGNGNYVVDGDNNYMLVAEI